MPAAARAGREDEKRATVAVNEVAIGVPFLANSRREDRGASSISRERKETLSGVYPKI